tara:strand:- start:4552 stop:5046 length:495 start_codon:yes stop_codon:yes gene_type:complete
MANRQLTQLNNPNNGLKMAVAVVDIADITPVASGDVIKTGVWIPEGALITRAFYHVHTIFAGSGSDAATVEMGITSDPNAFVAAIAINAADPGVYDPGAQGTLCGEAIRTGASVALIAQAALNAANMINTTVAEEIILTTAGSQTVLTGKLTIYVEYVLTGDPS